MSNSTFDENYDESKSHLENIIAHVSEAVSNISGNALIEKISAPFQWVAEIAVGIGQIFKSIAASLGEYAFADVFTFFAIAFAHHVLIFIPVLLIAYRLFLNINVTGVFTAIMLEADPDKGQNAIFGSFFAMIMFLVILGYVIVAPITIAANIPLDKSFLFDVFAIDYGVINRFSGDTVLLLSLIGAIIGLYIMFVKAPADRWTYLGTYAMLEAQELGDNKKAKEIGDIMAKKGLDLEKTMRLNSVKSYKLFWWLTPLWLVFLPLVITYFLYTTKRGIKLLALALPLGVAAIIHFDEFLEFDRLDNIFEATSMAITFLPTLQIFALGLIADYLAMHGFI